MNEKCSKAFVIERSVRFCLLFSLSSLWSPSSASWRTKSPALRGIPLAGLFSANVSTYTDDITVFVFRRLDVKAVKKAVVRYEQISGAKFNFYESEGLRLGVWRVVFCQVLSSCILGLWFGPGVQLEWNWSEIQAKVDAQVGTKLWRRFSRAEVCTVYIFPLILYRLSVLPLPMNHRLALQGSLSKLLWRGRTPMVRRQVCCQRPSNEFLDMPDLKDHWFAERLAYLGRSLSKDTVWKRKASDTFPRLMSDSEAEGRRKLVGGWSTVCPQMS